MIATGVASVPGSQDPGTPRVEHATVREELRSARRPTQGVWRTTSPNHGPRQDTELLHAQLRCTASYRGDCVHPRRLRCTPKIATDRTSSQGLSSPAPIPSQHRGSHVVVRTHGRARRNAALPRAFCDNTNSRTMVRAQMGVCRVLDTERGSVRWTEQRSGRMRGPSHPKVLRRCAKKRSARRNLCPTLRETSRDPV